MNRKKFLKNLGMGVVVTPFIPTAFVSCSKDDDTASMTNSDNCAVSPSETAGPFPIKSPADSIRENIVGNRTGIPLTIHFTIQNAKENCTPVKGLFVDLWQCDAKGNYSEYTDQLDGNFTNNHFLRGRQTTDTNGKVSFISIYPGWYPGRAPHLHLEIKSGSGKSLLITQVAFPDTISAIVYGTQNYKGKSDTSNSNDDVFDGSLTGNIADSVTGDTTNGYILTKIIKVNV